MTASDFRATRKRLGITQAVFAEMLGIAQSSVCDFERGVREVPRTVELACWAVEELSRKDENIC